MSIKQKQMTVNDNTISLTLLKIIYLLLILGFFLSLFSATVVLAQERKNPIQGQEANPEEQDPCVICLEEGKKLYWQQEYKKAIEKMETCIQQDSDNPEIYYYMGQSYFQLGQQSILKASRYFRQAYEISDIAIEKYYQQIKENLEENHTNQYLRLAYIYQIRSLIPGVDEYQQALDIYGKLLEEKPSLYSVYYHMGWIYYQQQEYQKTIDTYLKYLDSGMKSDFVYYHLGLSYDKINEKQKADDYFERILKEFPDAEMADRARKELQ